MRKKKKKKKKQAPKEDFGSVELYCRQCDFHFNIDWETIWDIQEITHGYIGYHLYGTYISCPKCGEVCTNEEVPQEGKPVKPLSDDDLPF